MHAELNAALAVRYRIERQLAADGMASVYLAQGIKHDRQVAIKVLKSELAAVLGAERFVVEIETTASLQHPHILPLSTPAKRTGCCTTSSTDSDLSRRPDQPSSPEALSCHNVVIAENRSPTTGGSGNRETWFARSGSRGPILAGERALSNLPCRLEEPCTTQTPRGPTSSIA
jgi:hypothetical protein